MLYEFGMSGKWLELLKELAPRVARAGVLRDSSSPGGIGQFAAIQAVAPSMGMELSPLDVRDAGEIERVIALFGRSSDGGLMTGSALAAAHRKLIVALAARHRSRDQFGSVRPLPVTAVAIWRRHTVSSPRATLLRRATWRCSHPPQSSPPRSGPSPRPSIVAAGAPR